MEFLLTAISLALNQDGQKLGDLSLAAGCELLPEGGRMVGQQ
jgi:hypothetical protein